MSDKASLTSNEQLIDELKWAVSRHCDLADKYTLQQVLEAKANLLKAMRPVETSEQLVESLRKGIKDRDRKIENQRQALESKQAKIDALMLEFCPGEMSAEQKANWAAHQIRSEEPTPRREYHANGTYWSGVPTVDVPCDFCTLPITDHDPRTHACPPENGEDKHGV